MKRFLFVFAALCAAFCSADAFARALCPDGMTQKQCCTKDGAYDYVDAKTICGLGNIQDSNGYYADCYVCGSSLIQPSTGCGVGCAKCTGSYCKTCESGFYMKSGKCFPCEFIPVENGTCTACSSGTCTEVSCKDGYKANGTTCEKISCPAGQYNTGSGCSACPAGTYSSAAGAEQCTKCAKGSYSKAGATSCTPCAPGTYAAQDGATQCDTCGYMTWSATSGASSCDVCASIPVSWGICCQCSNTGTCTHVQEKPGNRYACNPITTSCPAGQYLNKGVCEDCSKIPVENGTCKACTSGASCDAVDCNIGYKTVGTTCVKVECPLNCAACDSWGFCYQCESGYTLSDDRLSCLPSCPENCKTCSNGVCTDCNDGYTLNNGKCLDCSVYNVGNGTCTACDEYGCTDAECNGSNAFFNPTFRKCGAECDVNQYLDSSYTCRNCPAGQTSPGGWFANPTDCYSCDSIPVDGGTCTECKNGSCTKAECEDGYVLDSTGRTCIAALASCLSPLKISDDGCCCVK